MKPSVGLHQEEFWYPWALERHMRKKTRQRRVRGTQRSVETRGDTETHQKPDTAHRVSGKAMFVKLPFIDTIPFFRYCSQCNPVCTKWEFSAEQTGGRNTERKPNNHLTRNHQMAQRSVAKYRTLVKISSKRPQGYLQRCVASYACLLRRWHGDRRAKSTTSKILQATTQKRIQTSILNANDDMILLHWIHVMRSTSAWSRRTQFIFARPNACQSISI